LPNSTGAPKAVRVAVAVAEVGYGYADTRFGQIHYAEAGQQINSTLLLLHQTPRSHDEFAEVLPLLARQHHVVAIDMLGFGLSAKPHRDQAIEQYAAGALAALDALGIGDAAVLGHHTGAIVAIEVAASAPGRIRQLVLSSPQYTDATWRARHADGPGVDDATAAADGSHLVKLWSQRSPYYPPDRPDLLNRFIRDCLAPGVDPRQGHLACARYEMEDRIGYVTADVLILAADADPFALPGVKPTEQALTNARSVTTHLIEGGMIPLMEQKAAEVAEVTLDFLATHPVR
jgi:pimeloyl-ACP methyl ester carboxylesterase